MALFANYPFALAPGMGLNAYFAYTVVLGMGYSWQVALTAVFVEGLVFIVLSLTNVREAIFNAIPMNLKAAVSVGIIITGILVIKDVKGNILWGILITWVLGIICQFTGLYVPDPELGFYGLLPDFSAGLSIPSLAPIFGKLDFSGVFSLNFVVVIFAFLFVDMFDTIGTLIGVSSKANMPDEEGKLPRIKGALLADSIATTAGTVIGASTTTTFVESASGVSEGGRTGLTSVTTALLFGLSLFLSPIFLAIPSLLQCQ